ncbi:hypothetical protein EDD85DRAFT_602489 [Armillaria nabsnona]|nr:hypothetical protein EDD85DRAFT_602489 [Armillaria nabsnona]
MFASVVRCFLNNDYVAASSGDNFSASQITHLFLQGAFSPRPARSQNIGISDNLMSITAVHRNVPECHILSDEGREPPVTCGIAASLYIWARETDIYGQMFGRIHAEYMAGLPTDIPEPMNIEGGPIMSKDNVHLGYEPNSVPAGISLLHCVGAEASQTVRSRPPYFVRVIQKKRPPQTCLGKNEEIRCQLQHSIGAFHNVTFDIHIQAESLYGQTGTSPDVIVLPKVYIDYASATTSDGRIVDGCWVIDRTGCMLDQILGGGRWRLTVLFLEKASCQLNLPGPLKGIHKSLVTANFFQ